MTKPYMPSPGDMTKPYFPSPGDMTKPYMPSPGDMTKPYFDEAASKQELLKWAADPKNKESPLYKAMQKAGEEDGKDFQAVADAALVPFEALKAGADPATLPAMFEEQLSASERDLPGEEPSEESGGLFGAFGGMLKSVTDPINPANYFGGEGLGGAGSAATEWLDDPNVPSFKLSDALQLDGSQKEALFVADRDLPPGSLPPEVEEKANLLNFFAEHPDSPFFEALKEAEAEGVPADVAMDAAVKAYKAGGSGEDMATSFQASMDAAKEAQARGVPADGSISPEIQQRVEDMKAMAKYIQDHPGSSLEAMMNDCHSAGHAMAACFKAGIAAYKGTVEGGLDDETLQTLFDASLMVAEKQMATDARGLPGDDSAGDIPPEVKEKMEDLMALGDYLKENPGCAIEKMLKECEGSNSACLDAGLAAYKGKVEGGLDDETLQKLFDATLVVSTKKEEASARDLPADGGIPPEMQQKFDDMKALAEYMKENPDSKIEQMMEAATEAGHSSKAAFEAGIKAYKGMVEGGLDDETLQTLFDASLMVAEKQAEARDLSPSPAPEEGGFGSALAGAATNLMGPFQNWFTAGDAGIGGAGEAFSKWHAEPNVPSFDLSTGLILERGTERGIDLAPEEVEDKAAALTKTVQALVDGGMDAAAAKEEALALTESEGDTVATKPISAGSAELAVADTSGIAVGDSVVIGAGTPEEEEAVVAEVGSFGGGIIDTVTGAARGLWGRRMQEGLEDLKLGFEEPLAYDHAPGTAVELVHCLSFFGIVDSCMVKSYLKYYGVHGHVSKVAEMIGVATPAKKAGVVRMSLGAEPVAAPRAGGAGALVAAAALSVAAAVGVLHRRRDRASNEGAVQV